MSSKKVHILLATFNRAHLVPETLKSIQNQTYPNWECIIVDDHSSDSTAEVIKKFTEQDDRFTYFLKDKNYSKGLSGSRNYALDIAEKNNAEIIQFFDDDDIMHPEKLELQVLEFEKNDNLDLVLCKYEGFKETEDPLEIIPFSEIPIQSENLAEDFLFNRVRINSAGPLFKAYLFKEEKFDENLPYGEERELFLRVFFKYNPKHYSIEQYLFFYRHHQKSITAGKYNYLEKLGAVIVLNHKLWDFLYINKLLTSKSTGYLLRQFLLQDHNKLYINKVEKFTYENRLGLLQRIKLRGIINFHRIYTKIVYKLMLH